VTEPLRVLYSGRLVTAKRVAALLEGVALAIERGVSLEAVIVGDGPERSALEAQARAQGITQRVRFVGALPFADVMQWYEWAHCLVLPSQHSEGWPKVLAEAMCHGLLCIAVAHGQVPAMLEGRGILLPRGTGAEIAEAFAAIAGAPAQYQEQMRAAAEWARQFSLEGLREALANLLAQRWRMPRTVFPLRVPPLANVRTPQ
jgi:glycosyltransferase involved in cell wall biosynthesis